MVQKFGENIEQYKDEQRHCLYVSRLKLMQFYEELPYEPISEI